MPASLITLSKWIVILKIFTNASSFVPNHEFQARAQPRHFQEQHQSAPATLSRKSTLLRSKLDTEGTDHTQKPDTVIQKQRGRNGPKKESDSLNKDLGNFRRNRQYGAQLAHERLELALKERDPTINEKSFNTVLVAYAAQSGRGDWMAPLRSEQLLQKMKRQNTVSPSVFTYNAVMEAWVKSAAPGKGRPSGKPNSKQQGKVPRIQKPKQRSIVQAKNTVLRLFDEMAKERDNKPALTPNTYSYNLVLELYAKSPNPHDLRKAEDWFLNMECEPDRKTFNLMFAAHAKHGKAKQAAWLLSELTKEYQQSKNGESNTKEKSEPQEPSKVWFHCVFKAYGQDQKAGSLTDTFQLGEQADQLLADMDSLWSEENLEAVKPDAITYNHILNVHAQAGNTQRVAELIQELEKLYSASDGRDLKLAPDRITYTTALKAYANAGHECTDEAEELFQRMLDLSAAGRPNMSPSIVTYNTMIQIWAKTGCKEDLKKATELLKQMQQQSSTAQPSFLPGLPRPPPPNAQTLTAILHGWSRTHHIRESGYKAEELMHMLEQLPPNARRNLDWTLVFNSVITAWSKSGDKAAPQRVEALLNLLEDRCFDSGGSIAPDKTTFLCIADTYAKSRIPDAEQRCDDLLVRIKRLEEAGVVSNDILSNRALYNSILNALAKSGQPSAKDKAEEILTMMQTSHNMNLRPDIVTFATVIDCHTKSGSNTTADRAEELLRFVEGSYRNGDALLKPNAVFYSGILQAWAKTATLEGAEKAEQLLRRNEGLYQQGAGYEYAKPHAILFNAVMDSVARSGMPEAGVRAEDLLHEMMSLYEAGEEEMKPTRRSFNAVMLAYRHDGKGAEKAERLLDRMEELADTGDFMDPDVVSYNCAIQAIVEDKKSSARPEDRNIAASRAQALLDRMEERSIKPDAATFSSVIEAWLKCNDEKGSVMAELMLQKFLDQVECTKDWEAKLNTDIVWDVINAYRSTD